MYPSWRSITSGLSVAECDGRGDGKNPDPKAGVTPGSLGPVEIGSLAHEVVQSESSLEFLDEDFSEVGGQRAMGNLEDRACHDLDALIQPLLCDCDGVDDGFLLPVAFILLDPRRDVKGFFGFFGFALMRCGKPRR